MNKSDLIARLAERHPHLTLKDAEAAAKTILDAMEDALAQGQRIEVRGFGSFQVGTRPPRVGRNPMSGDAVVVPAKRVAQFKVGKLLRDVVLAAAQAGQALED